MQTDDGDCNISHAGVLCSIGCSTVCLSNPHRQHAKNLPQTTTASISVCIQVPGCVFCFVCLCVLCIPNLCACLPAGTYTTTLCIVDSSRQLGGLMQCLAYWSKIKGAERWGPEWSLQALAAAQRVQLSLSAFADNIYSLVQPHAESFKSVHLFSTLVLARLHLYLHNLTCSLVCLFPFPLIQPAPLLTHSLAPPSPLSLIRSLTSLTHPLTHSLSWQELLR